MPENAHANAYPLIEEKLTNALSGDALNNALDFAAFLLEKGMTPDPVLGSSIRFNYMGKETCILVFFKDAANPSGVWVICDCPIRVHDGFPLDEELQAFARAHVMICHGEHGCPGWPRGGDKEVFGQAYASLCSSEIQFINPDADELIKIRKLMDYWMRIIADGATEASISG